MEQSFWYGNNRLVDDNEWYGSGGVGINLSGEDWLGLGAIFTSASQGTALCGARPMFAGQDRDDWEECNKTALQLYQQEQISKERTTQDIEKRKQITTIVVVTLAALALILTVVFIIRRKRRN